jgi:enoyl-CoA hydratase
MSGSQVLAARDRAGVLTITLNRPAQRNALNEAVASEFSSLLEEAAADGAVRAICLTGAGAAFCAGGDLGMLEDLAGATEDAAKARMRSFYDQFLKILRTDVPTVAAVHGAAMGAGLALALACDIRVGAREGRYGLNFVKLGLSPGMGCTFLVPRICGPARAADLLLTGRSLSGEEAMALGLFHEVLPAAEVRGRAERICEELAAAAPLAVRETKRALRRDLAGFEAALDEEASGQARCYPSADLREGVAAARERRPARFEGR